MGEITGETYDGPCFCSSKDELWFNFLLAYFSELQCNKNRFSSIKIYFQTAFDFCRSLLIRQKLKNMYVIIRQLHAFDWFCIIKTQLKCILICLFGGEADKRSIKFCRKVRLFGCGHGIGNISMRLGSSKEER